MLIMDKLTFKECFSDGEKALAEFILDKGREIDCYSIRSLAEHAYTSPATMIRLCKKLGFSGFDEFKKNFMMELDYLDRCPRAVDFNFPFEKHDTPMKAANSIAALYEETIRDTMSLLQLGELRRAAALLRCYLKIYVYSAGTAINQAESFREKMLKIGRGVTISNNLNYQLYEI